MTTDTTPITTGVLHAAVTITVLVLASAVIDVSILGLLAGVWTP